MNQWIQKDLVLVTGEITTTAKVDFEAIIRQTIREIGYTSKDVGLDADNCRVMVELNTQSPDIAQGVNTSLEAREQDEEEAVIGAGNQGLMYEPVRVDTIVISTQHDEDVTHAQIVTDLKQHVIERVIDPTLIDEATRIFINPTGRFVIGGPDGDARITGEKLLWIRMGDMLVMEEELSLEKIQQKLIALQLTWHVLLQKILLPMD